MNMIQFRKLMMVVGIYHVSEVPSYCVGYARRITRTELKQIERDGTTQIKQRIRDRILQSR